MEGLWSRIKRKMKKRTTIFRQLILNVVLPAVIALVLLGILNYHHTRNLLQESSMKKNLIIMDEIFSLHEMQDMALDFLEDDLDPRMKRISNRLINDFLVNTDGIDSVNLDAVRDQVGLDGQFGDIYLINRLGTVVNTTFDSDKNLNLFSFGPEHEKLLTDIFNSRQFVSERIAIESKTGRLRKYTYQPTKDGQYIVELGLYSSRADSIIQFIRNRIIEIGKKHESIVSVDLFIGNDYPVSLTGNQEIVPSHMGLYKNVLTTQGKAELTEREDGGVIRYDYIYMGRKNSDLYSQSVLRIVSDRTGDQKFIRTELLKFFIILSLTIIVVILLLYRKTRVITDPIKNLVEKLSRISDGHLSERAEIQGNNEIASLSEQFNDMISQLESYYYELEEKVKARTLEINQQKEEILAQRDSIQEQRNILSVINIDLQNAYTEIEQQKKHIEDSIHYAKRIQNAILPPDDYVNRLLPDSFILYKPKDIVSGDFYWLNEMNGKILVGAVDCTGHGVPGAFMSIVGYNQLNYAVNVKRADRPDEILNLLNEGVTKALRQTRITSSVKDGMDVALISIDKENKRLQYSGAFNPLYFIHNKKLLQIKADKFPAGGYMGEKLRTFSLNEFEYKPGDVLYLFSDGFADQFGGEHDSKFLVKRFRDLLFSIHAESMSDQKAILSQTLKDWTGDRGQLDDILVMGIRL